MALWHGGGRDREEVPPERLQDEGLAVPGDEGEVGAGPEIKPDAFDTAQPSVEDRRQPSASAP